MKTDRVDRFVRWIRNHRIFSVIIIGGLILSAVSQTAQNIGKLSDFVKKYFSAASPSLVVDLAYNLSNDLKSVYVNATVVNVSDRPLYLQCVGLHCEDRMGVSHIWLKRSSLQDRPLAPGAKNAYTGTLSVEGQSDSAYQNTWLSVESNAGTIFNSKKLTKAFSDLVSFANSYVSPKDKIVRVNPVFTKRLEVSSEEKYSVDTFSSCTQWSGIKSGK